MIFYCPFPANIWLTTHTYLSELIPSKYIWQMKFQFTFSLPTHISYLFYMPYIFICTKLYSLQHCLIPEGKWDCVRHWTIIRVFSKHECTKGPVIRQMECFALIPLLSLWLTYFDVRRVWTRAEVRRGEIASSNTGHIVTQMLHTYTQTFLLIKAQYSINVCLYILSKLCLGLK